jgi:prepilin-type N-terminal cleavage/methylation domain-containing protein
MKKLGKKQEGFTLIELMIVVAIIAIIAAIAIPNLLRSRMSANEASAAGMIRTISTSQVSFQAAAFQDADADGMGDYGTLAQLGDPDGGGVTPPYIDSVLSGGTKAGYTYVATPVAGAAGAPPTYTATAVPQTNNSGYKRYFCDESGVIRFTADGTAATVASVPMS